MTLANPHQNRSLQEFMWVAVPKSLGGVLQILLNVILIRELGPDDFGIAAVCLTLIVTSDAILGPSIDLGVLRRSSVCRETDANRARCIQKTGLTLKLICLSILAALMIVAAGPLSGWLFQRDRAASMLVLSAFAVLGLGLLRSVQMYFQIERRFKAFGLSDILQNGIKFAGIGLVLATRPSVEGVLIFHIVGPAAVSLGLLWTGARPLAASSFDRAEARALWKEIQLYAATTALGSAVVRMDVFFVTAIAGTAEAGIFAAANTFALVPQLLGMYMSVVFTPRIMPMLAERRLAPVYKRFQLWLGVACVAIFIVAQLCFPWMARWLLPASFTESIAVFMVLLPAALCSLFNFPWTVSFLLFSRPRSMLTIDLVALPILLVSYPLAVKGFGAMGAAGVTAGFALFKSITMQGLALRVLSRGPAAA